MQSVAMHKCYSQIFYNGQRSLSPLLSEGSADITGSMSGKVNYYVGKLSVTQIPLSMKLSGVLGVSDWKTELGIL